MSRNTSGKKIEQVPTPIECWLKTALLLLVCLLSSLFNANGQTTPDDSLFDALVDQYVADSWKDRATGQADVLPGMDSEGIIGSFIYIGDYEVRHEVLIPLSVLKDWAWVAQTDTTLLEVAEQDALGVEIEAFFADHNPVQIDGIMVEPVLARTDYYAAGQSDLTQVPVREAVEVADAWVGIILSYSTKGAPDQVAVTWDLFEDEIREVRTAVYAYEDNLGTIFTPDSADFSWVSPGRPEQPPIVEIRAEKKPWWIFWEGSGVSDNDARSILTALLKNIYRAFDYHSESDTYDALAKSVDGDLLSELYLQIHRSLKMQEQGGAISRIQEVSVLEGRLESLPDDNEIDNTGFSYQSVWTAKGTVEHWGHIHSRTNQYKALFTVEDRNESWKITDLEVLSQEQIKFESTVREPVTAVQSSEGGR